MIGFPEAEVLSENTVRIPFQLADHLIILKGSINGQQGNLILDTGSKNLVINKNHFKQRHTQIKQGVGYSVTGSLQSVSAQRIESFNFNSFEIPYKLGDLLDLSHIEKNKKLKILGVMGKSVLYDFEIYIDFYLKQVTLFRTDNVGNRIDDHFFIDTPTAEIPFLDHGHCIVLNTTLGTTPLKMALDTGAEINFLDSDISGEALKKFRGIKRIKLRGMGHKKSEMLAGRLYDLRLDDSYPIGVMRTILADLSDMKEAYGTRVDGVLGYDFIAMKRLLINYKKKLITFVKLPYKTTRT
ncbi:hypothetical protein E7Z59_00420 [Robertkochia marina]|uniref:Clan AA aspartic protease n=1 Tax=Robertkochia marina TaxID=1227945 RepID=A0A4V3UYB0_9FLAO|nr:hypothetical protein [Robertkochia marina]THD68828.1 hypothetical protein E7Z59_00420 [Robertkochia marina]